MPKIMVGSIRLINKMIKNSYHLKIITLAIMLEISGCSLPPNQNHDRSNSVQTKTKWMNDPQADLNIEHGLTAYLALDIFKYCLTDSLNPKCQISA